MRLLQHALEQAGRRGADPAIEGPDGELTHGDFWAAALDLAERLRALGATSESLIGVSTRRSTGLSVARLGVWLSGAAWVPLDPQAPLARRRTISSDLGLRLVVADPAEADVNPQLETVPALGDSRGVAPLPTRVPIEPYPRSLAYVIHTSGSTGRPKAVGVEWESVEHLAATKIERYQVDGQSRVAAYAPATFDVAVAEFVMALANGATLVTPTPEALVPGSGTTSWLREARVSHLLISPSSLAALPVDDLPDLRTLGVGGEAMSVGLASAWGTRRHLVHGYGPTEATVWATTEVIKDAGGTQDPALGVAFRGGSVTVADHPAAPAGVGELLIAGAGIARGYLGRPAETAEAFVPDPHGRPGGRRYHSGDLVQQDPQGGLHFVGRVDDQVKIRGVRIEPGEISAAARAVDSVTDAVTVVRDGRAGPQLVTYVVAEPESLGAVRAELTSTLPKALRPDAIVTVDRLPLTSHGKLDLRALPAPGRTALGASASPADLGSKLEEEIAAIFGDLTGVHRVGADDDFFALGGHSLLVGRLVLRLRQEHSVDVSLAEVMAHPTVRALAELVERTEPATQVSATPPIGPRDPAAVVPLTFQQERVWFLERFAPGNLAYNTQASFRIRGPVQVGVLERVLNLVIARHDVLRTRFVERGAVPVQEVLGDVTVNLPVRDVPIDQVEEVVARELRHSFDLALPPLVRWVLLRHGAEDHTLVQVEHHFIHDGWSFALLMQDIVDLYDQAMDGGPVELPRPGLSYADYAVWQRQWLRGETLDQQLTHWSRLLSGAPTVLALPVDHPRPRVQRFVGDQIRTVVPPELVGALEAYSRGRRRSLFATMFAAFGTLLERYTEQRDLLVGTGSANRHTADVEGILGMLVNTLVLRLRLDDTLSFDGAVDRAASAVAAAYQWPDVPTDAVVRALAPERDASRNPLFQVMFSFHDSPVPDLHLGPARMDLVERHNGSAKADLNVVVIPRASQRRGREASGEDSRMVLLWEYATDLFDRSTMQRMVDQYLHLLGAALATPGAATLSLPLEPTRTQAVVDRSVAPDPVDVVRALVGEHPDRIALVDGDTVLTYAGLWARAGALAHRLRAVGAGVEERVVIHLGRGADAVVAQLAVLRAGAAFVPVDPDLPAARVAQLVRVADAVALVSRTWEPLGSEESTAPVVIHPVPDGVLERQPLGGPPKQAGEALAYVLFTSGSTGQPKGVEVTRANLASLMAWYPEVSGATSGSRISQLASVSFDASVMEVWGALGLGGTLEVVPDRLKADPEALAEWLVAQRIDIAFIPTAVAQWMIDRPWPDGCRLRTILVGGQALPHGPDSGQPWRLVNCYGPTEVTVVATAGSVEPGEVPTIGVAVPGATVNVTRRGVTLPVGAPGELAVGGCGVARGYAGDPVRTAAQFRPDPAGPPGARRYLTGDHGLRRTDGRLAFLGRRDRQVQLRGVRIELGEVTAALSAQPGVVQAAAVFAAARVGGSSDRILGFVSGPVVAAEVREGVAAMLPSAAVPSVVTVLETIPLTRSGKLDEAELLALRVEEPTPGDDALGAADPALVQIWTDVIGAPPHGTAADFFAAGGHSLLASRMVSLVADRTGHRLDLATFFAEPTFGGLLAAVDVSRASARSVDEPTPDGVVGLDDFSNDELADLFEALGDETSRR